MQKKKLTRLALVLVSGAFLLTGVEKLVCSKCAAAVFVGGEVRVGGPPPPMRPPGVVPMAPGPGMVWVPGAWGWGPGGQWVWQGGYWARPPFPGAVWFPPRYVPRRSAWVRGGWGRR